jgi:endo-1,4-beta-D-glucanase Y
VKRLALAAVVVAAAALAAAVALASSSPSAASSFLDRYMAPNGHVIRHDQGGDTVSEGQAYAMLLAIASGDHRRFDLAWKWTRTHLQRRDGLLSWHWKGRVLDRQSATDADLDAAWALSLAAKRWGVKYRRAAARIARGVLAHETARIAGKVVLVAGPWAVNGGIVNPSYFSPGAYAALARVAPDGRWRRLAADSRRLLIKLPSPPPDWARMDTSGIHATQGYGYDAFRAPVRYAAACSPGDRRIAAHWWPKVRRRTDNPIATVGAAASARAAGDTASSDALLDKAAQQDAAHNSYYGAAWVALAREMLAGALRCGA